jgi:lipoyl(octanoyl) transferase
MGLTPFKQVWDYQQQLQDDLIAQKMARRSGITTPPPVHRLIMCEHPPVFTLGKSGSPDNLLVAATELENKGIEFFKINRGGDITYHGPGQLVMYPIFDLEYFFTDIHKFLRYLEEAVIQTLSHFGIASGRFEGYTGVWIEPEHPTRARKICAMGIRCSRWVTMHGIALNVNTDLSPFDLIVPCGIKDKDVTSMMRECQQAIELLEVENVLRKEMARIFEFSYAKPH